MNPILQESDLMEVVPYGDRPVQVGDVILFTPRGEVHPDIGNPQLIIAWSDFREPALNVLAVQNKLSRKKTTSQEDRKVISPWEKRPRSTMTRQSKRYPIVHRVISVTPEGICTSGDNNSADDAWFLQAGDVVGQIVAVWRGSERRKISGGRRGRLARRWLGWRRALDRIVSHLLSPSYRALSHWGILAHLLPARLRLRPIVFRVGNCNQFYLIWRQYIIGRYDRQCQWTIQRPFRLLVDERILRQVKVFAAVQRGIDSEINPWGTNNIDVSQ